MKKKITLAIAIVAALVLTIACLTGCGKAPASTDTGKNNDVIINRQTETPTQTQAGGVLCLIVNPEIAVSYDANGLVTSVSARNEDAKKILETYTGYEGKDCKTVVVELVDLLGEAGYFVEEIEGVSRAITIEIEKGSVLPSDTFLDEVVADVKEKINTANWHSPLDLIGETDYGITDYVDTDYGVGNDGYTDYGKTDYGVTDYNNTDYGPGSDGVTDYFDTDYGPNNDGVTDYYDTDYGPNNDGVTDYYDTDYGPNNDGITDYYDTDYGPNNDGVTDYGKTDYGTTDYNTTDYGTTDYNTTDYGATDYFG